MNTNIINQLYDTKKNIDSTKDLLAEAEKILERNNDITHVEELAKSTSELLGMMNSSINILMKFENLNIKNSVVDSIKDKFELNSKLLLDNCAIIIQSLTNVDSKEQILENKEKIVVLLNEIHSMESELKNMHNKIYRHLETNYYNKKD